MTKRAAFISHASKDVKVAVEICDLLESRGLACWIAPRDIPPGASYGSEISNAIEQCAVVILVFTDKANASPAVANEIELAFRYQRVIIPIRLQEISPSKGLEFFVANAQWVDAIYTPLKKRILAVESIARATMMGEQAPSPLPENKSFLSTIERFLERIIRYKLLASMIVLGGLFITVLASVLFYSGTLSELKVDQELIDMNPATYGLVTLAPTSDDSLFAESEPLEMRASIYVNLADPRSAQMQWLAQAISDEGSSSYIELPEVASLKTMGAILVTIQVPYDTRKIIFCMSAEHPRLADRRAVHWYFDVKSENGAVSVARSQEATMSDSARVDCRSSSPHLLR